MATFGGAGPMKTGWAATRLGWTAYIVPFLFVYSPSLLLQGNPFQVALAVATAVGGPGSPGGAGPSRVAGPPSGAEGVAVTVSPARRPGR